MCQYGPDFAAYREQLHFNCEHIDDTNMLSLSLLEQ